MDIPRIDSFCVNCDVPSATSLATILVPTALAMTLGCGPSVPRGQVVARVIEAMGASTEEESGLAEANNAARQAVESGAFEGRTMEDLTAELGRGEDCGSRPLCSQRGFVSSDWTYQLGVRDGFSFGPVLIFGFDNQGRVQRTFFVLRE